MGDGKSIEAKVVLLGDSGVGKTSVSTRYVQATFAEDQPSTIGASFLTKRVVVGDWRVKLSIWDTAGAERFRSMTPMYYRSSQAAVVMYDVGSEETFAGVESWINELRDNVSEEVVIAIVANKCDLPQDKRCVSTETGRTFALKHDSLFFETSALSNTGIDELFQEISAEIVKRRGNSLAANGAAGSGQNSSANNAQSQGAKKDTLFIGNDQKNDKKSGGGCGC